MSKNIANNFKSSLDTKYESLCNHAKSPTTQSKLINIHKCAGDIVRSGGTVSIPAIVKMLNTQGIKITKRTIYNKRDGGNPYRELIDLWIEYSILKTKTNKPFPFKKDTHSSSLLTENEITSISDHVLRYKLTMMTNELLGVRKQINLLQQVKNMPKVTSNNLNQELTEHESLDVFLDEYDLEAIKAIQTNSASNLVEFDETGSLVAKQAIKRGESISQPGLQDALSKIIKSYTLPNKLD